MPQSKQRKKMKKLADILRDCRITVSSTLVPPDEPTKPTSNTLDSNENLKIIPQSTKEKVPPIFLHKPVDFRSHVRKILVLGINIFRPHLGNFYTKIKCQTFEDHKALVQYFENNKLPYHTYGHPDKMKMKVVIKGLPNDTNLNALKEELVSIGIPIVRVHKMHTKGRVKPNKSPPMLVLAVVPNTDEGKKILQVEKLLGEQVKMESPIAKTKQCHRCQKWGHSQRYCHGQVKCVKCAGDHFTSKCLRNPAEEPPKCANCGKDHTANYKKCSYCPESTKYKASQERRKDIFLYCKTPELVTLQNYDHLYKNIAYLPKDEEESL